MESLHLRKQSSHNRSGHHLHVSESQTRPEPFAHRKQPSSDPPYVKKKDSAINLTAVARPSIGNRKIKSLSKYDFSTLSSGEPILPRRHQRLSTMGSITRKPTQMAKYSISRERQNCSLTKQKPKRPEEFKIQQKRSFTRAETADVEEVDLQNVMGEEGQGTLHDLFVVSLQVYRNNPQLALQGFKTIYQSVGELSIKNMMMIGLCHASLQNASDSILHIARVLQKTNGNMYMSRMNYPNIDWNLMVQEAYYELAESYRKTSNFLSGINAISQWIKHRPKRPQLDHNYQTLQPPSLPSPPELRHKHTIDRTHLMTILQEKSQGSLKFKHEEARYAETEENIKMYLLRARLYVQIKNYENAVQDYNRCMGQQRIEPALELISVFYATKQVQTAIRMLDELENKTLDNPRDAGYVKYHRGLIYLAEGRHEESLELMRSVSVLELQSQVAYFKALLMMKRMQEHSLEPILMQLQRCVGLNTSSEYSLKAYYLKILIMVFQKKDYYGAQYEADRVKKFIVQSGQTEGSGISKVYEERSGDHTQFDTLFRLVSAVIYVLKMKINKGLELLNSLSIKGFGVYSANAARLLDQFKFYAYYVRREYENSLKYANRLLTDQEWTVTHVNKAMLQCLVLIKEKRQNHALAKIAQMESALKGGASLYINNSLSMVKSVCYMLLYTTLERQCTQENSEVLLSAQQLLRHCLITEKQNHVIYYLIAVIHHELAQYESSLKYIREALQYCDQHMLKHYYCKANAKLMLGRYDQAIKDYSNALLVYNQHKSIVPDQYYTEPQIFIPEIYLCRAIAYLKYAYSLSGNYSHNSGIIGISKQKAAEDLNQYFRQQAYCQSNCNYLQLYLHTEDSSQLIKSGQNVDKETTIRAYYLNKQLNNCIAAMRAHMLEQDSLRAKQKRKKGKKMYKYGFDLRCLEALKKSSSKSVQAIEESLVSLLELTEQVYQAKQKEVQQFSRDPSGRTLQQLFADCCGQMFKWSDVIFFIGVMHFQLRQYDTALKYFEESMNEKKNNAVLYSLEYHLLGADTDIALDGLFENRTYCNEQIQYNIGLCHLMMGNYKQAREQLQSHQDFLSMMDGTPIRIQDRDESEISERQSSIKRSSRSVSENEKLITPFPSSNRLCSIYEPQAMEQYHFGLSFCLPQAEMPLLGLFHKQEVELGSVVKEEQTERQRTRVYLIPQRKGVPTSLGTISLMDIQMKPIAPWVKQSTRGVMFTDQLANESVDINTERESVQEIKKEKTRKHRYS